MQETLQTAYSTFRTDNSEALNAALRSGFYQHEQSPDIKRSHLFDGRYENIYLDESHIPELKALRQEAVFFATQLIDTDNLQAGLWFNHMPPGSVTLPHRHDDDDELLSAVYYISVPQNSGDLLIHNNDEIITIVPEESLFVFFKPDVVHEVSQNKSAENRLSIGINFGLAKAS